jgi:CBS-domain-containing membrane protein
MEEIDAIVETPDWKPRALIIGTVIGALVGLGAAYLYSQRVEADNAQPRLRPADGVRLGVLVMALLRSVAELGESGK